jgi:hypothetical protein
MKIGNTTQTTFGTLRVAVNIENKDQQVFDDLKTTFPADVTVKKSVDQYRDFHHRFDVDGTKDSENKVFAMLQKAGLKVEKVEPKKGKLDVRG